MLSDLLAASPVPRCEDLAEANTRLQEHLDQANMVNSALQEDIGKLAADWMRAQKELELKESEWRTDREVRTGYGSDARAEWECIVFLA